jgi:hypothetical protein
MSSAALAPVGQFLIVGDHATRRLAPGMWLDRCVGRRQIICKAIILIVSVTLLISRRIG